MTTMTTLLDIYTAGVIVLIFTFLAVLTLQVILGITEIAGEDFKFKDPYLQTKKFTNPNELMLLRFYYFILDKVLCMPYAIDYGDYIPNSYPITRFVMHLIFVATWPIWIIAVIAGHICKRLTLKHIEVLLEAENSENNDRQKELLMKTRDNLKK